MVSLWFALFSPRRHKCALVAVLKTLNIKMDSEILFSERYGALGHETIYVKSPDQNVVVCLGSSDTLPRSLFYVFTASFREVFLPQGYPESVSADYLDYQIWDTVQAFCSSICGALTTQAIMKGVGVGDNVATPLGAAVMWIFKDGTGMVGRIVFAWWKGTFLDADCKKWRLFADFLNDIAMGIELFLPYFMEYSMQILCLSTSMKAIVGVAGGATRAAITQHQAIRDNMADVSAKDGSQETFVNLTASMLGILILSLCTEERYSWGLFITITILHLYANYKAVRSLRLLSLNPGRLILLLQTYLTKGVISCPEIINKEESVFLGSGLTDLDLCGHHVILGTSLKKILSSGVISAEDLNLLANLYRKRKYMLVADTKNKKIYVALQHKVQPVEIIEAYFHAVLLGICISLFSGSSLKTLQMDKKEVSCPLHHLETLMNKYNAGSKKAMRIPLEAVLATDDVISKEFSEFFTALRSIGWSTQNHQLGVDEWRSNWTSETHLHSKTL
ncbi:Uncharacterized protein GBIM_16033 [Gryllus bimaculatus]|nr:Uncharacterized protein GBIM_16033 [Gryllus bimaculatus]